jgi:NADH:ubiquinone oxidoreductase subunit 6 (subunit J)
VQSLLQLSFAGFGIAALPLGLLAEAVGRRQTIALMGAIATAAVLVYATVERASQTEIESAEPELANSATPTPTSNVNDCSLATVVKPSTRSARR